MGSKDMHIAELQKINLIKKKEVKQTNDLLSAL
jgi:hypothetical protein